MPLVEVKAMLLAATEADRDRVLLAHLSRMEDQLERTQAAIASLRTRSMTVPRLRAGRRRPQGTLRGPRRDLRAARCARRRARARWLRTGSRALPAHPDQVDGPGALRTEVGWPLSRLPEE